MSSSSCTSFSSRLVTSLLAILVAQGVARADAALDYQRYCAPCHGATGNGRGRLARFLSPRPRNFTRGAFKFRSTASGSLPRDEDLLLVIDDGLAGTSMIGWKRTLTAL